MLWSSCGCSQGKWCDWTYDTYRWRANTRNETRTVRDWGPRLGENRGGRVGKLDSTSSLRLDKDPRWAREVGNVRLYSCRSSVCWRVIHALRTLRRSGMLAPKRCMATIACSMPASVYSRVARKRRFSTLSLRSAVENGSFCSLIIDFLLSFPPQISMNVIKSNHCAVKIPSVKTQRGHIVVHVHPDTRVWGSQMATVLVSAFVPTNRCYRRVEGVQKHFSFPMKTQNFFFQS